MPVAGGGAPGVSTVVTRPDENVAEVLLLDATAALADSFASVLPARSILVAA